MPVLFQPGGVAGGAGAGGTARAAGPAHGRPDAPPGGALCPRDHLVLPGGLRRGPDALDAGDGPQRPHGAAGPAFYHGVAPGVGCLAIAANTLWCLGYPAQALRRSQEALALAQALAHPYSLAFAQLWAAVLHHHRREVPAVQGQADALLALATAQGFPFWVGTGTFWQGWALAMQDQDAAGLAQMQQGCAAVLATGQS